jgi:hypothetical protein
MDVNALPTDPAKLTAMLLGMQEKLGLAQQQIALLSSTVAEQQQKLEHKEHLIAELLKALRGKQRERINPDQLLLFEIGELEAMIKEETEANEADEATSRKKKRKTHGRRLIPDHLPEEVITHELPEAERL